MAESFAKVCHVTLLYLIKARNNMRTSREKGGFFDTMRLSRHVTESDNLSLSESIEFV